MNPKMILFAIETLVRQSPEGEFHGTWYSIADKLICEIGGPLECEDVLQKFETCLRNLGLEKLTANSEVEFIVAMDGELNFVDRKLILDD